MELILSDSFEEMKIELGNNLVKMMEFVIPVTETEKEISIIATSIKSSGKLLLMHGIPGVGKSTFIQSLQWRSHMPIREVYNLNASKLSASMSRLPQLFEELKAIINNNSTRPNINGVYTIVIDYLESLEDETPESKKSFFRDLNGFLRQNPVLIIWPMTEENDVTDIISFTRAVSGTLFYKGKEVLHFKGPNKENFSAILKNTISVLNPGYIYSDFQLTEADFNDVLKNEIAKGVEFTLRDYISDIRQLWYEKTDKVKQILNTIPKPTEIWFVFSMPEAEQIVSPFVRKSQNVEECWDAYHAKLDEYIHGNQKAEYWDSNRLQLAISGAFKTKLMYLSTNALVSCLAAYGKEFGLDEKINWDKTKINKSWYNKSTAKRFLSSTPVIKQILGETATPGASRGVKNSLEDARIAFDEINKLASGYNLQRDGSDKPFNKTIASALREIVPNANIIPERKHPWIENIYPDITIETEEKLICLEFHYTKKDIPSAIATYVLNKLDIYMRQIENKYPKMFRNL